MPELVNGNAINETHARENRYHSQIPLRQLLLDTMRFGEYHPHLCLDGITSDKLPIRSSHDTRSYSLKAPLMQDVRCNKDYFEVPLRAVLPNNADKIITNPTLGDDVPSDAYTNVADFIGVLSGYLSSSWDVVEGDFDSEDYSSALTDLVKMVVICESIFSYGSLLSSLGCSLSASLEMVHYNPTETHLSIDAFVDLLCYRFIDNLSGGKKFEVTIDGQLYNVYVDKSFFPIYTDMGVNITFREFWDRIHDTADWLFDADPLALAVLQDLFPDGLSDDVYPFGEVFVFCHNDETDLDLDLVRLWAYQLVCAEFFSNSHVDYIYSAQLFREYISTLVLQNGGDMKAFSYNGINCPYDWLSAAYFVELLSNEDISVLSSVQYLLTLFGYKRSLRYKDYFTGARTRPLAIGDVSVTVNNQSVSVVDVTRKIQLQRFLNNVNATGRKFEEYIKGIFGVAPSPDHHNPLFLAHSSDLLFANEVENTGDAQQTEQNSVTAVFRGNSSNYEYTVQPKEGSVILGLTSFDIERCYRDGVERSFFTKDRFDMFLPDMQFVGDQPIYRAELTGYARGSKEPISYTFRDMQYKQLVNRARGGFAAGALPGYGFYFDLHNDGSIISPDFIRSRARELDPYYISLSGWSLGTYFHFICKIVNTVDASRPMVVNPQILQ